MKKQNITALILILSLVAPVFAQRRDPNFPSPFDRQPQPQQQQQQQKKPAQDEDEVVRINTNLVQVDAVVKDKNGKLVTNLRAEDFEVLENGKPQPITDFSFIATDSPTTNAQPVATTNAPASKDKNAPPAPPIRLRPEQVRRTVALVVDDACMTTLSIAGVREGLKKFVDTQMQPNDLVAIFRSSSGSGALQQFTSDRAQLYRAIRNIRWLPARLGQGCQDNFEAARADYTMKITGTGARTFEDDTARGARERIEDYNKEASVVGTLGTLGFVVRGLHDLPGRKSAVLISDGLPVFSRTNNSDRTLNALRRVTELANRSSVVIYTMDARGLVNPAALMAADEVLPNTGVEGGADSDSSKLTEARNASFRESQNGLNYLASETGGLFVHNANNLDVGLGRIYDDQRGYYLIGYHPTDFTLKQGLDFSKIKIRVKQSGLTLRYRHGFYGSTVEPTRTKARTADSDLFAALTSPIASGNVRLRLASFFGNDPRTGSFMRSLLYIDPHDITFADDGNGWKKLVLDVVAVTFDENGKIIDQFNRTHTIRAGGETYQQLLQNGLYYSADVPVKKPGAYQFRMAVRDAASKKLGSASQFIEVPDLKSNQLALSGLILSEARANAAPTLPPSVTAEAALAPVASPSDLAVRIFRPGAILSYSYLIYNPRLSAPTHQPKLTTQMRIYREGQLLLESPETPFDIGQQKDLTRLTDDGAFRLKANAAPGEYVLQITVKDAPDGQKPRTSSQWIDFEVVK